MSILKKKFTKKDYSSDNGMLTSIWGPSLWHVLHCISFNYPVNPSEKDKKNYYKFIKSLEHILPCKYCRINLPKNMKNTNFSKKIFKNRDSFSRWIFNLHEEVNKNLGKKK